MRASLCQRGRCGEPNAAPAAGDERALAVEAEGGVLARSIGARLTASSVCSLPPCGGGWGGGYEAQALL